MNQVCATNLEDRLDCFDPLEHIVVQGLEFFKLLSRYVVFDGFSGDEHAT